MMRSINKRHLLVMLFASCSFLLFSQSVNAAKPVKNPPSIIVIDAVTIDEVNNRIVITGSGLQAASTVTLGGVDVQSAISPVNDNQLNLVFDASTAAAVPGPGSYSLVVEGKEFSVYFNAAVVDPVLPVVCPCVADWEAFGTVPPPEGFSGLTPSCTYVSAPAEDQAAVQLIDYPRVWILTTEYNDTAKQCALVLDAPTRSLNSIQEHQACVQYLKNNYITPNPGLPSCL